MKKWDVVIIGSGISSLTAAAILAKKGRSVCVLEQHAKPGGYLHCFNRFGHRFDTGAHYAGALDKGQSFHSILSYLGVYNDSLFTPLDPDGFDEFSFPGFSFSWPKGFQKVIRRLCDRFPHESEGVRGFFDLVQTVSRNFPTYSLTDQVDLTLALKALDVSLGHTVEKYIKDPDLRSIIFAHSVLHGVDPYEVAFGMHCLLLDSFISGPYGFAKGGDAVADEFVRVIQKYHGEVHLKTKVSRLIVGTLGISEVQTEDGQTFQSDWVISGIHPKTTLALLSDSSAMSPAFKTRIQNLQETVAFFGLYGVSHSEVPLNPRRNYYYFRTTDLRQILISPEKIKEPCVLFMSPADRSGSSGNNMPINAHAIGPMSWFRHWENTALGRRGKDYELMKSDYAEMIVSALQESNAHIKFEIKKYVASTPLSNIHYNGTIDGSAYGIYHSMHNTGARALGPRTKIPNLLLTGQNTLFPGLLGSTVSGLRTAGNLVGIKNLLNEIRG